MDDFRLGGRLDQVNRRWIEVISKGERTLVSLDDIINQPNVAFVKISRVGLILVSEQSKSRFKKQVEGISKWDPIVVADRRGWHEGPFVLANDFVTAPRPGATLDIVLDDDPKWGTSGKLAEWQEVADLMRGQSLVIFCASFAFAPPLLALLPGFDNIGVEVISKTSKGKTTLCKWVSSIWGGDPSSELGFMASWLRTLNALEPAMHAHADCLLTLDEGNFAGGGSGDRDARGYSTEAVFRLSGGVPKDRYGSIARPQADRLCWLSNGNVSIVEKLKGADPDVVSAVRARLITLSAQASAEFGVFNRLPPNVANSGAAIDLLNVACTKYYGTPIRAYLTRLARERARLNDWVRFLVNAYIQEFIEAAGIDRNDGPTLRVAKSFGLIYAAGRLAKLWGILPSTWKIGEAVMQWYRARISAPPPAMHRSRPPAFDQVLDYARRHRQQLFDLRVGKPELNDEAFSEAYGFLKPVDGGGLELLIPPPRMHGEFSDYQSLMKELRHQGRARVEGGRQKKLTTKAAVRRNEPPDRVYCVRVGSALI